MVPSLADVEDFGKAIWFTSELEEAKEFGKYVFKISNDKVNRFKNKKIAELPHGLIKKLGLKSPGRYHMVVLEKIPLKYLEIVQLQKHK